MPRLTLKEIFRVHRERSDSGKCQAQPDLRPEGSVLAVPPSKRGSYLRKYYQWLGAAPQIIHGYYSLAESSPLSEHFLNIFLITFLNILVFVSLHVQKKLPIQEFDSSLQNREKLIQDEFLTPNRKHIPCSY